MAQITQTLTDRDDKKHSIRFNANSADTDPALTSVYVSKLAMHKAGIDPAKVRAIKITIEPVE